MTSQLKISGVHRIRFCVLLLISLSSANDLSFIRERVDAYIHSPDTLEIKGLYIFSNANSASLTSTIYYPFPVDSASRYPYAISVIHCSKNKKIPFDTLSEGIQWNITLSGNGVDSFLVTYRQRVNPQNARYIVTTAQLWGKPLQSATFSVTAQQGTILDFWSFTADSIYTRKNSIVYLVKKSPFWPDSDMRMSWKTIP